MYVSVVIWTLRPGKTYEDFVEAWYPTEGTTVPGTIHTGASISNKREVVVVGLHETDLSRQELARALLDASAREVERNRRIAEVAESSRPGSIFEVGDTFEL
jgi:hypothetical protein